MSNRRDPEWFPGHPRIRVLRSGVASKLVEQAEQAEVAVPAISELPPQFHCSKVRHVLLAALLYDLQEMTDLSENQRRFRAATLRCFGHLYPEPSESCGCQKILLYRAVYIRKWNARLLRTGERLRTLDPLRLTMEQVRAWEEIISRWRKFQLAWDNRGCDWGEDRLDLLMS